jgi:hypothetical protein
MLKSNLFFNSLTVGLLSIIVLGIYTLPKFNYNQLAERQQGFEFSLNALIERMTANGIVDGDVAKRAAIVQSLQKIPEVLSSTETTLSNLSGRIATLSNQVEQLAERLRIIESNPQAILRQEMHAKPDLLKELPTEIHERQQKLSPQILAQGNTEMFLKEATEMGLLDPSILQDTTTDLCKAINLHFAAFQSAVKLIDLQQDIYIQGLISAAKATGEYIERPSETDRGLSAKGLDEGGVVYLEALHDRGVQRLFEFSDGTYPDLLNYEDQRNEARNRLFSQVFSLVKQR